jgi:CRP-like cAMP-binding protein
VRLAREIFEVVEGLEILRLTEREFSSAIGYGPNEQPDSDVLLIDPPSHEELVERVPGYAAAFRKGLQRRAAAREERIVNALSKSAEERYLDFLDTYPSIVTRVPQWMLASYLGVSPETISRIRKKFSRKSKA